MFSEAFNMASHRGFGAGDITNRDRLDTAFMLCAIPVSLGRVLDR